MRTSLVGAVLPELSAPAGNRPSLIPNFTCDVQTGQPKLVLTQCFSIKLTSDTVPELQANERAPGRFRPVQQFHDPVANLWVSAMPEIVHPTG